MGWAELRGAAHLREAGPLRRVRGDQSRRPGAVEAHHQARQAAAMRGGHRGGGGRRGRSGGRSATRRQRNRRCGSGRLACAVAGPQSAIALVDLTRADFMYE